MSDFVHLHNHTQHSLLDGLQRIPEMVSAALDDGQRAIAVTDHGPRSGWWQLATTCRDEKILEGRKIKPIYGIEIYLALPGEDGIRRRHEKVSMQVPASDDFDGSDTSVGDTKTKNYEHLTVLARTRKGYENLIRAGNDAEESFWNKPLWDYNLLRRYSEGIIVGTGCLGGPVAGNLLRGDTAAAEREVAQLVDIFGAENVFVEVMHHDIAAEVKIIPGLVEIARKFGLLVVATNDCHYTHMDQATTHDAWLCMSQKRNNTQVLVSDEKRFRFNGSGYHLRTAAEMHAIFDHIPGCEDAVSNSAVIADMVEDDILEPGHVRLPDFDTTKMQWKPSCPDKMLLTPGAHIGDDGYWYFDDADSAVYALACDGVFQRFGDFNESITQRLREEFPVVKEKGFSTYFLHIWDFTEWATSDRGMPTPEYPRGEPGKKKPIIVGPGRGSGPGSLLLYVMGITAIDPLSTNLMFSRFLDPSRTDLPDVDTDFEGLRRHEVIAYIEARHGADNVALMGTEMVSWAKSCINSVARVTGRSGLAKEVTKTIVTGSKTPFSSLLDPQNVANEAFQKMVSEREDVADLVREAMAVEGIKSTDSIHACGIVIGGAGDPPLRDSIPLRWSRKGDNINHWVTQWSPPDVGEEGYGLVKMDMLGIKTLDIVATCCDMVHERHGRTIDVNRIPFIGPEAEKTFQMLCDGRTAGVFQLASGGMTSLTRSIRPNSFDDLAALVALFRPGPMGAGMHTSYALRKNGQEPIDYGRYTNVPAEQEVLRSILDDTLGLLCVARGQRVYSVTRGLMVPVEDISVGELVQGVDEKTGQHRVSRVSRAWMSGHKPILSIRAAGGHEVKLTGNHPVLTTRGWVRADELTTDDSLAAPRQLLGAFEGPDTLDSVNKARFVGMMMNKAEDPQASRVPGFVRRGAGEAARAFVSTVWNRGGVIEGRTVSYSTPSRSLCDDMRVMLSRWGITTVLTEHPSTGPDGAPQNTYRIEVTTPDRFMEVIGNAPEPLDHVPSGVTATESCWLPVESIRDAGTSDVFDLTVEGTHSFVCEGIVVHNCYQEGLMQLARSVADFSDPEVNRLRKAFSKKKPEVMKALYERWISGGMSPNRKVWVDHGLRPATDEHGNELVGEPKVAFLRSTLDELWRVFDASADYLFNRCLTGDTALTTGDDRGDAEGWTVSKLHNRLHGDDTVPHGTCPRCGEQPSGPQSPTCAGCSSWLTEFRDGPGFTLLALGSDGRIHPQRVKDVHANGIKPVYSMVLDNGMSATSTGNHRWMTPNGWVELRQLHEGSEVVVNGADHAPAVARVVSIEYAGQQETFDVEMDEGTDHNFVANGIISHNSHSYAYGYDAWVTAWLKANYPAEFTASLLRHVPRDRAQARYAMMVDLMRDGITILPPDINKGGYQTSVDDDGKVRLGLAEAASVGKTAEWIVRERERGGEFTSLADLRNRVRVPQNDKSNLATSSLSVSVIEGLIQCGATDSFGPRLGQMMVLRSPELPVPDVEWGVLERSTRQRRALSTGIGDNPLVALADQLSMWREPSMRGSRPVGLHNIPMEDKVPVCTLGVVASAERKNISSGHMWILVLEGSVGSMEVVVWPNTADKLGDIPKVGDIIAVTGKTRLEEVEIGGDFGDDSEGAYDLDDADKLTEHRLSLVAWDVWRGPLDDPARIPSGLAPYFGLPMVQAPSIEPGPPVMPEVDMDQAIAATGGTSGLLLCLKQGVRWPNAFGSTSERDAVDTLWPDAKKWVSKNINNLGATNVFTNDERGIDLTIVIAETIGDPVARTALFSFIQSLVS